MNWMKENLMLLVLMPGMLTAIVVTGYMVWDELVRDLVFPPIYPDENHRYPNGGFMPYPGCVYGEAQIRLAHACLFLGSRTSYHTTKS